LGVDRNDRTLVREAQRGSRQALSDLYAAHWPDAHRAAYLVVRDAGAAEDIAQDAFLAAVDALDRFDRRRPFAPWLHRIVVNRAIDWGRREALRRSAGGAEADEQAAPAARQELGEDVMEALAGLPVEQRAVVVLRHLLEYTPGEIARMLDLPRGTVNSRLRRALDQLGSALEETNE
jgi:RNA polymerase sigma-70 factor (ECF subfamily)